MKNAWCVRAEFGTYTPQFLRGSYVAIGWLKASDLSHIATRDQLYPIYREAHQDDTNLVVGQQVGQIARFLIEMQSGDLVITPDSDTELLHHGIISSDPSYVYAPNDSGCPYPHRRRVTWSAKPILRSSLSVPLQHTLRSSLTVFQISQFEELVAAAGHAVPTSGKAAPSYDPYGVVLEQILQLDAKEFEILTAHLLTALGFEGSEVTGQTGDGGVDAKGELNVDNLAKVKIFVQAKRYKPGIKISAAIVKQLRQAIPFGGQGAFITTADFQAAAFEIALEAGFPRIGLINGRQLVDLLVEHWADIPAEFRERLGLKPGLVRA